MISRAITVLYLNIKLKFLKKNCMLEMKMISYRDIMKIKHVLSNDFLVIQHILDNFFNRFATPSTQATD